VPKANNSICWHWFSVVEAFLRMLDILMRHNGEGGSPTTRLSTCDGPPVRKGARPKTIIGPLHVQCNGHGDPKYLNQLVNDVLSWPHVESTPPSSNHLGDVSIRPKEIAATSRFFGIYERDGVWPSASCITDDHFGITPGMCSLGHR